MYAGVMLYFFYSHPPSKFKICNMAYGFRTSRLDAWCHLKILKLEKVYIDVNIHFFKKTLVHVCILSKYYVFIIDSIRALLNSEL